MRYAIAVAGLLVLGAAADVRAQTVSDLALCADERVKTALMPAEELAKAEAACTRILEGGSSEPDRQKAAFFRGLMRFLQAVESQMIRQDSLPSGAEVALR